MVTLIKNEEGKSIGWKFSPITDEEQLLVGTIRDLQFFGLGDTSIKYNGLELIEPENGKEIGNIKSVSWIQKKYKL
jgi:hypothetical protein